MLGIGERVAAVGVAAGAGLFGLTWAELGEIVRVIAGLCSAVSFIAAAYYYVKKGRAK
jgi:hypothetical protein